MKAALKISSFIFWLILFEAYFCSSKKNDQDQEHDQLEVINSFKVLFSHFAEPYLQEATVKGVGMEGFVNESMIPIVGKNLLETTELLNDKKMKEFAENIMKNSDITNEALKIRPNIQFNTHANQLENRIFKDLQIGEYNVIPLVWGGSDPHGINLIIEKTGSQLFSLVAINTGAGIEYHQGISDETGTSPILFRLWQKYENIPLERFTEGNHWFIQALGMLRDHEYMVEANRNGLDTVKYFYGTFLGNFKNYKVLEKPSAFDDRYMRSQISGSCVYSSVMASILYFSTNRREFHRRRYVYGQVLLKNFMDKYRNHPILSSIMKDAFESTGRYLMKHVVSGIALQTLEYLESENAKAFKTVSLLGKNRPGWSSRTNPDNAIQDEIKALQALPDLKYVKTAIGVATELAIFISSNKIDVSTARIKPSDITLAPEKHLNDTVEFSMGSIKFYQKVEEKTNEKEKDVGRDHPYIKAASEYGNEMPRKISNIETVISTLKMIEAKSGTLSHVDRVMRSYVYDFFKIIDDDELVEMIKNATQEMCNQIMKMTYLIARNFVAESELTMALEDYAAFNQLFLLTWRVALRYDELEKFPLGLKDYNPPIGPYVRPHLFSRKDPNGDPFSEIPRDLQILMASLSPTVHPDDNHEYRQRLMNTCDAAPGWLSTADEYAAWKMLSHAQSNLAGSELNPSFFPPQFLFPHPAVNVGVAADFLDKLPAGTITLLTKLANTKSPPSHKLKEGYGHYALLPEFLALTSQSTKRNSHPQFYNVLDIALSFYVGLWCRPCGHNDISDPLVQLFPGGTSYTSGHKRKKPKRAPEGFDSHVLKPNHKVRTQSPFEIMKHQLGSKVLKSKSDFYERQFVDVRMAESLREPQNIIHLNSFLNFIENSESSVFFSIPRLVHIFDHLLSSNSVGDKSFRIDQALSSRIGTTLKKSILSDLDRLSINLSSTSRYKRQKIIDQNLQATLLLTRFIYRLNDLELLPAELSSKTISTLYMKWLPLSKFDSNYELTENYIGKIHTVLWNLLEINIENKEYFENEFKNIYPIPDQADPTSFMSALTFFHYSMGKIFLLKEAITEGDKFDLVQKLAEHHRITPQITSETVANLAGQLFKDNLLEYYLKRKDNDNLSNDKFKLNISDDYDIFEFDYLEPAETPESDVNVVPYLIIKISTGRLLLKGEPVLNRSKITENATFNLFFNEEERKYAQLGGLRYFKNRLEYGISDFRGYGKNFLFVTESTGQDMDILFFFEGTHWIWTKPGDEVYKAIVDPLRLINMQGLRVFYKFAKDDDTYQDIEVILIRDQDKTPMYRYIIEYAYSKYNRSSSKFLMKMPMIADPEDTLTLLDDESIEMYVHNKIIQFSKLDFISIYRNSQKLLVIVFGPYRYGDDQVNPVMFKEEKGKDSASTSKFVLVNDRNWILDEDQTIGQSGNHFPGGLKLVSLDGNKQTLLLPRAEWKKSKNPKLDTSYDDIVIVENIPILNGELIPKSRIEKLLFAYKSMVGLETLQARRLLHPDVSIDQNSPFDESELQIFRWILELEIKNPEISSLKLIAATLVAINKSHFPQHYSSESMSWIASVFDLIRQKVSYEYLASVREISKKFYVHRVIPDVLFDDIFEMLFTQELGLFTNKPPESKLDIEDSVALIRATSMYSSWISEKKVYLQNDKLFYNELDSRRDRIDYVKSLEGPKFLALLENFKDASLSKNFYNLYYRRQLELNEETFKVTDSDYEAILFCVKGNNNDPEDEMARQKLQKIGSLRKDLNLVGISILQQCIKKYFKETNPISPVDNSPNLTELRAIKNIFANDLKSKSFEDDLTDIKDFVLVDDEDKKIFDSIIQASQILLQSNSPPSSPSNSKATSGLFSQKYLDQSAILRKLDKSIEQFKSEKLVDGALKVQLSTDSSEYYSDLNGFVEYCKTRRSKIGIWMQESLMRLSKIIQVPIENENNLINELNFIAHMKKSQKFENLYGCYFTFSLECFQQKFPHILKSQLRDLRQETFLFYSNQVLYEFLKQIIEQSEQLINKNTVLLEQIEEYLGELKKLLTFNERIKMPGILNFEYRSGQFRLREDQLDDLNLLLKKQSDTKSAFSSNYISVVIQRMMAAGKTLILGTLGTILKAREEGKLSIIVPPASLFQSNSASMQSRTYKYFKSRGNILHFKRLPVPSGEKSQAEVLKFLKWFQFKIDETIRSRDYLILSPDSLMSFMNSYIEYIDSYKSDSTSTHRNILLKMSELYQIFSKQSSIILDEIDMTMNPKLELNFPTIEREEYNLIAVILTTDIFEWSVFSQKVKDQGLLLIENNQAGLIESDYKKITKLWLEYIEQSLQDKTSIWHKTLIDKHEENIDAGKIMHILRTPSDDLKLDIANYNGYIKQVNALIILKVQIEKYLRDSFRYTVREHFGPAGPDRSFIKYAVPYVAANTPSSASLFADRWETLNKSLMMVTVIDFAKDDLADFIAWIKEQIDVEATTSGDVALTATWNNFVTLIGIEPLAIESKDTETCSKILLALNSKSQVAIRLIYSYLLDKIISKLDFPVEQITSNALNMAAMFGSIQGYSGTIDNVNILPSEVVPEAHKDNLKNEKNNGGIIRKILLDTKDSSVPIAINLGSSNDVDNNLDSLLKTVSPDYLNSLSALIDAGAFFKNFQNAQVAVGLLKANVLNSRIKCVLYYDELSNMMHYVYRTDSGSEKLQFNHVKLVLTDSESILKTTGFDISERFTFYDQRHITGSDILQPVQAVGLLTVGPRNLLRDILQGTLRMRQFMTTQRVLFVTSSQTEIYFRSLIPLSSNAAGTEFSVSDLITLTAINEDEKQTRENAALTYTKLDVNLRKQILDRISADIQLNFQFDFIGDYFKPARSLFIRSIRENPITWLKASSLQDTKDSVDEFIRMRSVDVNQEFIKNLGLGPLISPCNSDENVSGSVFCFAPKKLPKFDAELAVSGTEMQLELNVLQLIELDLKSSSEEPVLSDTPVAFRRFNLAHCEKLMSGNTPENVISIADIETEQNQDQNVKELLKSAFVSLKGKALVSENIDVETVALKSSSAPPLKNINEADVEVEMFVSRDLINIVERPIGVSPHSILSPFNREGTHIFIAVSNAKKYQLILVSSGVANEIYMQNEDVCKFGWILTDLTGVIVSSQLKEKLYGLNVFETFPDDVAKAFFNLLVFNGSLLQISTVSHLKHIYKEWLKKPDISLALTFLLARMDALQRKADFMFDPSDPLMNTIKSVINGDSRALGQLISGTYDSIKNKVDVMKKHHLQSKAKKLNLQTKSASSTDDSIDVNWASGIYCKPAVSLVDSELVAKLRKIPRFDDFDFTDFDNSKLALEKMLDYHSNSGFYFGLSIGMALLLLCGTIAFIIYYRIKLAREAASQEEESQTNLEENDNVLQEQDDDDDEVQDIEEEDIEESND